MGPSLWVDLPIHCVLVNNVSSGFRHFINSRVLFCSCDYRLARWWAVTWWTTRAQPSSRTGCRVTPTPMPRMRMTRSRDWTPTGRGGPKYWVCLKSVSLSLNAVCIYILMDSEVKNRFFKKQFLLNWKHLNTFLVIKIIFSWIAKSLFYLEGNLFEELLLYHLLLSLWLLLWLLKFNLNCRIPFCISVPIRYQFEIAFNYQFVVSGFICSPLLPSRFLGPCSAPLC